MRTEISIWVPANATVASSRIRKLKVGSNVVNTDKKHVQSH